MQPVRIKLLSLLVLSPLALSAPFVHAQASQLPPGTSDPDQTSAAQQSAAPQSTDGPLANIESEIEQKHFDQARTQLDQYLATHPDDARALFDRGYCDDAEDKGDQALAWYRKAVAADPKQFEAQMALGLALADQNSTDEAVKALQAAVALEPNPPNPAAKAQAYRTLARLLAKSDPDDARDALLAALKLTQETPEDTLLTASIAEAEDDPTVAEQAYRQVLKAQPEDGTAIAGLAHLLISEKKFDEATPLVHSALLRDPDDPALNAQYAALLAAQGKGDEATATLEKLHTLKPQDRQVSQMLADAYVSAGALDKADALYAALLSASPNDPDLLSARGQLLIGEQKYAEALPLFQQAVKLAPQDADAWSGVAFAASKTGNPTLELDALAARSKLAPETPATYFLWATAHDHLHHTKQAVEYYRLFLSASQGKLPDEEWQAKQRLALLSK
ncbi:tetratricopeptide repeat protein [Silvibacterium sp.]|uniref:tetratricopeptide repeat protein n=1 Tax=Silvibacterium sp. TaxID=1964179 RepID=UPI0039E2B767